MNRIVETDKEAKELALFLRSHQNPDNPHLMQIIVDLLWDHGSCKSVHISTLCSAITNAKAWRDTGRWAYPPPAGYLRELLLKRIQRANDKLADKNAPYIAAIRYCKATSQAQLIVDPVRALAHHKKRREKKSVRADIKAVDIRIESKRFRHGTPILSPGDLIKFKITSPISGYLHVFHVDSKNTVEVMFPAEKYKKTLVRAKRTDLFPGDYLREGCLWKIVKTKGVVESVERFIVVVTGIDIDVATNDLIRLGVYPSIKTRGIAQEHYQLADIPKGRIAVGDAKYIFLDKS